MKNIEFFEDVGAMKIMLNGMVQELQKEETYCNSQLKRCVALRKKCEKLLHTIGVNNL